MENYSYLGSGIAYLREAGTQDPLVDLGNCSQVVFSPQEDERVLQDFRNPGGGTYKRVARLTGVETTITFHDFNMTNLATHLRGGTQDIVAGTATAEEHVAIEGGFIPTTYLPSAITSVTDAASGDTVYDEGVDYEVRAGGIYILEGTTIPAPTEDAGVKLPNIAITYTYGAQQKLQALVNTGKVYELVFAGLNEARSGKQARVVAHRLSQGLMQQLALIADEFGAGEVTGRLESDPTKVGDGVSKYFTAELEN